LLVHSVLPIVWSFPPRKALQTALEKVNSPMRKNLAQVGK
jgi:hypothetical protein